MPTLTPNLWFSSEALLAAEYYVSLFPNSEVRNVHRMSDGERLPPDSVVMVEFVLDGQPYTALNGGPARNFTEAISFVIDCEDQAEVDHYWNGLTDGGEPSQCGWLKDRFGISWQVIPSRLGALLGDPDPDRAQRAMQAMLGMQKIDIAALEAAADGGSAS